MRGCVFAWDEWPADMKDSRGGAAVAVAAPPGEREKAAVDSARGGLGGEGCVFVCVKDARGVALWRKREFGAW